MNLVPLTFVQLRVLENTVFSEIEDKRCYYMEEESENSWTYEW